MNGKHYPEEFKIEAVKQAVEHGHSVSSVARNTSRYRYPQPLRLASAATFTTVSC